MKAWQSAIYMTQCAFFLKIDAFIKYVNFTWCVYDKDHMSALRLKNRSESDPRIGSLTCSNISQMTSRVGLHIRSSHVLTDGMPVVKVNQSAWRRSPIPSAKTVSFDSASRPFREEITAPFDAKAERQGRTLCPLSRLVFHLLRPSVRLRHDFFFSFSFFSCVFPLRPSSYVPVSLRYSDFALRPLLSSFSFAFILTFRRLLLRGFRPVLPNHDLLCFHHSPSSERIKILRVDFFKTQFISESLTCTLDVKFIW